MKRIEVRNVVSGKKIPTERMPRHIAYHEAGHAVMATILGVKVVHATCNKTPGRLGHVQYNEEKIKPYHAILIAYAGTIAEQLGTDSTSLEGRRADEESAAQIADSIGFPDATQAIPHVLDKLVVNWGAVDAVAQALLREGELLGEALRDLIGSAPAKRPPDQHLDAILGRTPRVNRAQRRRQGRRK